MSISECRQLTLPPTGATKHDDTRDPDQNGSKVGLILERLDDVHKWWLSDWFKPSQGLKIIRTFVETMAGKLNLTVTSGISIVAELCVDAPRELLISDKVELVQIVE